MDDKNKLFIMKVIGALFVACIIIFLASIFIVEIARGTSSINLLIILVPAILIIVTLIILVKRQSEGVESGMPIDDEMTKRIKERSGYLSYMITLYFVLGLMWYNFLFVEQFNGPQIPINTLIFGILFFMIVVYFINWVILNKSGVV